MPYVPYPSETSVWGDQDLVSLDWHAFYDAIISDGLNYEFARDMQYSYCIFYISLTIIMIYIYDINFMKAYPYQEITLNQGG